MVILSKTGSPRKSTANWTMAAVSRATAGLERRFLPGRRQIAPAPALPIATAPPCAAAGGPRAGRRRARPAARAGRGRGLATCLADLGLDHGVERFMHGVRQRHRRRAGAAATTGRRLAAGGEPTLVQGRWSLRPARVRTAPAGQGGRAPFRRPCSGSTKSTQRLAKPSNRAARRRDRARWRAPCSGGT